MKSSYFSLSLIMLAVLAGCSKPRSENSEQVAANLPQAKVHAFTLKAEEVPSITEVSGTVRPVQRAMIAAKVMGVIGHMPVVLGQHVKVGELLVSINAGEISARVLQAKSQLNQVQRDLKRERDLLEKNASTSDMVNSLEDRFAMTQAMVNEAEVMLGYASVLAPFDGVVARKMVNEGDLAAPGMPLLEIEGLTSFQVEAGVPDSLAAKLITGTPVAVEIPAAGLGFTGNVVEISPSSDAYARNVLAKISVPEGLAVRSGQFTRARIAGTPVRALLVPLASISTVGQLERAFIEKEGRAVLRLVKTGAVHGERVEILSGLAEGDRVLIGAPASLQEGQSLEVQP